MQIDEKVKQNSDGKAGQDINDKKERERGNNRNKGAKVEGDSIGFMPT